MVDFFKKDFLSFRVRLLVQKVHQRNHAVHLLENIVIIVDALHPMMCSHQGDPHQKTLEEHQIDYIVSKGVVQTVKTLVDHPLNNVNPLILAADFRRI